MWLIDLDIATHLCRDIHCDAVREEILKRASSALIDADAHLNKKVNLSLASSDYMTALKHFYDKEGTVRNALVKRGEPNQWYDNVKALLPTADSDAMLISYVSDVALLLSNQIYDTQIDKSRLMKYMSRLKIEEE